jgi:hypothetical protein
MAKKLCIGMFGTCGETTWRKELFIPHYEKTMGLKDGVEFFNPQVEEWDASMAEIEAEHLAEDAIILFPITHETYGLGSIAETGFSLLNAIRLDDRRDFIIMVDQYLDDELMENKELAKESLRGRALILQHLKKLNFSNVYIVDTLDEMLEVSSMLFSNAEAIRDWRKEKGGVK